MVLGSLPACGADLGKANFPRATVSAQPGGGDGQLPAGPITDAAVAPAALRVLDPCPFISKTELAYLGTPNETNSSDFDRCFNEVRDLGGKVIKINIEIGNSLPGYSDKVNGVVEGLPQIEEKPQGSNCTASALTSKTPDLAITVLVTYDAGDPCRAAVVLLQKVIKRLHESPPKYELPAGTLLPLDPCATVDDQVLKEVVPAARKVALGLHNCAWNGSGPQLLVSYRRGATPVERNGYQKVDLGGGVSGFQRLQRDNGSQCTVDWQHRPVTSDDGEIASLDYTNYHADAAKDDPCGKAVKLAKNVISKLPKP